MVQISIYVWAWVGLLVAMLLSMVFQWLRSYVLDIDHVPPPFWIGYKDPSDGPRKGRSLQRWSGRENWCGLPMVALVIISIGFPSSETGGGDIALALWGITLVIASIYFSLRSMRFVARLTKNKAIHTHKDDSGEPVEIKEIW